ncbi:hypothetical protein KAS41_04190 [Candidatus Parcubacteria bacterium]|nr:hypothetical protein [Candidatus Parcubacteria bacterium]
MGKTNNFKIIYKELERINLFQKDIQSSGVNQQEANIDEIDEIAKLRRIVLEVNESEPHTYTSS